MEAARKYGLSDVAQQYPDPDAALAMMAQQIQQYRQVQPVLPYAQLYQQHQQQFQEYLRHQQEQQRQQAQAQQQAWWKAPEFKPEWRDAVEQDPQTGQWRVKDGYPPDTVQRLREALLHQRQFLDRFAFDPIGSIKPGIEEVVREEAQKIVQQHLGGYQDKVFSDSWVANNREWLFQQGPNGPVLSPSGQQFGAYVQQLEQAGIRDVRMQQQLALGMLQRDAAVARLQQLLPAQQQQQANQNLIQGAAQNRPQPSGSVNSLTAPGAAEAPSQNAGLGLADRLRRDFAAAGLSDGAFHGR